MSAWLAPPVLVASVVMVLFALIPSRARYLRVAAVVGWAAVWTDGVPSGDWLDVAGGAVVAGALGVLGFVLWHEDPAAGTSHGGPS